jgi:hypothetical protein
MCEIKNNNILILLPQLQLPTKEKRFSCFTAECGSTATALQQHPCLSKPILQLPSPTKLKENAQERCQKDKQQCGGFAS